MPVVKVLTSQLGDEVLSVLGTTGNPIELIPENVNTSGGVVPLPATLYVSKASAVGSPDGSIGAPFTTIAAAIVAAKLLGGNVSLVIEASGDGDYSAEGNQTSVGITILGFATTGGGAVPVVVMPTFNFNGTSEVSVGNGVVFPTAVTGDGVLFGDQAEFPGGFLGTLGLDLNGCALGGDAVCSGYFSDGCSYAPGAWTVHCSGTGVLITNPATDPTQAGQITFTGAAGEVVFDARAAFLHESGGGVVVNGTLTVQSRGAQAQVTVATPVLAAAALGYVDVNVSGTELAPLTTTDVVTVNPTADLHAAGAAGGFLASARVSAANTVRLAFVGTLAGGNVDFRIARA